MRKIKLLELLREFIQYSTAIKGRSLLCQLELPKTAKSSHHFLFYQTDVLRNTMITNLKFHCLLSLNYVITFLVNIFHFHASVHPCTQLHVFIFLMLPHKSFSQIKILGCLHSHLCFGSSLFKQFTCICCHWMEKSQNLNNTLKKALFWIEEEKNFQQ